MERLICIIFLSLSLINVFGQNTVRRETILYDGWKFKKGYEANAYMATYNDSEWEEVSIPHDWAIEGPFDKEVDKQSVAIWQNGEKVPSEKTGRTGALPHIGEAWYRKKFKLDKEDATKKIILFFEGAMSQPKVFVNGKKVGEWNYGYSYFYFDISNVVNFKGENTLAVHLKNDSKSSRWYPGAGLYRKVNLIVKNKDGFDQWGTFITTPKVAPAEATVSIKTTTRKGFTLVSKVLDENNYTLGSIHSQTSEEFTHQTLNLKNAKFWSPETPHLYYLEQKLYKGEKLVDHIKQRFGIRSVNITAENGFELNGKRRKLKGVCLHHDLGPLGTAVNRAAIKRQLKILKDLGVDAIRSAHNMPSLEQLELCDEMGFMFLAESFDEWRKMKVENGYHRFFDRDAEKDIVNLVRATRNHPSIIMWSSGNEVPDQNEKEGAALAKKLQDIFHREDPTRKVTVGMDQVKTVMESGFGSVLDVPGLNYRVHLYEEAYKTFPQGFILGSETASTVSSRGVYKFPVTEAKMKQYDDFQCSSYDLESCNWSNIPDEDFVLQDDKDWVIGEFVWTGFDYLGEPTPYDQKWPSRSSYFGIADLAGLPKDRYYLYRSRWNTNENTLHILPHWNWKGREGEITPVFVYTNFKKAELFLNGKSLGIREKNKRTIKQRYRLMWMDVKYEPGELKVVALDNNNVPLMEKIIRTAEAPYKIILESDRSRLNADGKDLCFVTASVIDKNGVPCPLASNELEFNVTGKGFFKAACNGDATSLVPFQNNKMKLFSGKLVTIIQSTKKEGEIQLNVKGKGLIPATLKIKSYGSADKVVGLINKD
ncbi:glycoside hydrolase family 2 TIM barrel-domain containing protein [Aquimarina agarilytica]|uniref:glycoside hydrolase family 2 TIM barrel-domain containing protein n=1 Tax=Aquimarina agarilytica TaxID=1087449 RepID=UPI000289C950|nr:glycoside hydrolase family 2 TIM barrel-domain containing protein [Aquimarina agarilytica]